MDRTTSQTWINRVCRAAAPNPAVTTKRRSGNQRRRNRSPTPAYSDYPLGITSLFAVGGSQRGLARVVSIQNPYNLLNGSFEIGLGEMAIRESVGLLAYSPLAFGVLSGKFLNGARPPESRVVRWSRFGRYSGEIAERTAAAHVDIARRHGLDPAQAALAFVNRQSFVTSNLIGATTMAQLRTNLGSSTIQLSPAVIDDIDLVHRSQPNPCP